MKYYNIPIFVPHLGCPFDCIFCNQRKITGKDSNIDENAVEQIIKEHLEFLPREKCEIEIAFFGGSFTGIDENLQERLLKTAFFYVGKANIVGIRVSTRPDYISDTILERLLKYGVTTIELGVQSMDEEVLKSSCRGHNAEDVKKAVSLIRKYPIRLGLQMMTGLPSDTPEKSLATADKIISLKPDIVRIYPTLVLKGTALQELYEKGEYIPQSTEEAVELSSKLLEKFLAAGINVIRIGLQNTEEISTDGAVVGGPFHDAFGELVESRIYYNKISELISKCDLVDVTIVANPKEISKVVGHNRSNVIKIRENYKKEIKVIPDEAIKKGEIKIKGR